ncbi:MULTISPECIES: hypothetical protein [Prauserella salsuginis group]|uniref:Uncharacterized protein n=2 Tax=Prauserella salsuginis group TaxID=2893672 RepID=A0A839XJ89_9PSEU|nr:MULTISPECIES: hypothetical protein [Prauserella salsuginis group]MBB3662821.1 hypothetical protein [Prauserella sediminis]MCR3720517.1 hypothetical protein [Prauserella flava]MCR3733773.1 hypothetical protein [Prauserella salsuginis]
MWVDDGSADTTATTEDMTVTVDGEEYTAELNQDVDGDGVYDAALIEHEDGSAQLFVDTDGDGEADQYAAADSDRNVIVEAEYDESSGQWVEMGGGPADAPPETDAGAGGMITADLGEGDVEVGPATIDTDEDGTNDTAIVETDDGNTIAFTDEDGDGEADIAVVIDEHGNEVVLESDGDGEWTETSDTSGSPSAARVPETADAWGEGASIGAGVEGVAKIDSATGQWISQN